MKSRRSACPAAAGAEGRRRGRLVLPLAQQAANGGEVEAARDHVRAASQMDHEILMENPRRALTFVPKAA